MYGYLNGYKYDDMDYISNQLEMAKVMQCIAYINVSKMPAPPISTPSHVRRCYNQWKPILYKQIETYTPDVIIFGNTFAHFRHDFEKCGLEVLEGFPGWVDIYKCRDRFLFDAYHPLQRKGDKAYINTLIDSLIRIKDIHRYELTRREIDQINDACNLISHNIDKLDKK
jgi:hypothetical protein